MSSGTSTVSGRAPLSLRVAAALLLGIVIVASPSLAVAQGAAKGTEILWDRYGVPHIFAPDHASLFHAYGYAQMEAHSELLLRLYAQARGRGAEYYGATYLDADRWVRTNGIPETAKKWASEQSAEFGPLIAAFVRGLNAWAAEHKTELSAEAQRVLPVGVEDVYSQLVLLIEFECIVNMS